MTPDAAGTGGDVDPTVRYTLTRLDLPTVGRRPRAHYELARFEGDTAETVSAGEGMLARTRAVTYLREVADLGGPDGPAALAALRTGWRRVQVPQAPEASP